MTPVLNVTALTPEFVIVFVPVVFDEMEPEIVMSGAVAPVALLLMSNELFSRKFAEMLVALPEARPLI